MKKCFERSCKIISVQNSSDNMNIITVNEIIDKSNKNSNNTNDKNNNNNNDLKIFLLLPEDLCSLSLSSLFVPYVSNRYKGLKECLISNILQYFLIYYLFETIYIKYPFNDDIKINSCQVPFFLQVIITFIYTFTCLSDFTSHNNLQVLLYCNTLVDTSKNNKIIQIRKDIKKYEKNSIIYNYC